MSLNAQGRMEIGLHVCSEAGVHGTVVKRVGKWSSMMGKHIKLLRELVTCDHCKLLKS